MVRKKEITSDATEKEDPPPPNWDAAMISAVIKETGAASTSPLVACTTL